VLGWWIWAYLTWFLGACCGVHTAPTRASCRTTGFACAPACCGRWACSARGGGGVHRQRAVDAGRDGGRRAPALDYRHRPRWRCALGFPIYAAIQFTSLLLLGPWPV
jgi:hypothetical protein